jgi:hypothetical protein
MRTYSAHTLTESEVADIPQKPEHYPNWLWSSQTSKYAEYWDYYDGTILEEECESGISESGETVKKYPLQINLARLAVQKHAFALLGEYDEASVVQFHAKPKEKEDETAQAIDDFLTAVWSENGAMGLLPEQARIAHICGGAVFKIAYDPEKRNKVRLEVILPDYFFPVWDSTDYHRLLEVEIAYTISTREAMLKYGYRPEATSGDEVLYKERWTEDEYEVTIGGQLVNNPATGEPYQGENPFVDPDTGRGILPFEYFPVDRTGGFYGTSIIESVMGLQDEYNARMADVGDAINEGVHPYRYGRNLPKGIKDIKLSRGRIKNLGMNAPNQPPPEIDYVQHPGLPRGTKEFLAEVKANFQQVSHTPPVAYGIDEGSQRSALTLAVRMWPTMAFVKDTRGLWSASFASMNRKIIIISMIKEGEAQEEWLGYQLETRWAPIILQDREQLVNENILLVQAKLRAPETAIRLIGDTDDIGAEMERIREWQEYIASLIPAKQQSPQESEIDIDEPEPAGSSTA